MNLNVPTLEVQMECFEGPLSVLINLIKRNKVDIFDIPIGMITERFLEYVEAGWLHSCPGRFSRDLLVGADPYGREQGQLQV